MTSNDGTGREYGEPDLMHITNDSIPIRDEVMKELERMLRSQLFKNSAKQSHILSFVVESALNGDEINENAIGWEVFPPFDAESHNVRQTAKVVRSKVEKYYKTEGRDDLVQIVLLPGIAYRCEFRYHPRAQVIRTVNKALSFKRLGSLNSLFAA